MSVMTPRSNVFEQHVLLSLVEAMHLVEEVHGPVAVELEPLPRRVEHLADLLHPGRRRVPAHEHRVGPPRDQLRQRRLPRARRPVEQHAAQPVRRDEPRQRLPRPEQVLLTRVLLKGAQAACGPRAARRRIASLHGVRRTGRAWGHPLRGSEGKSGRGKEGRSRTGEEPLRQAKRR